MINPSEFLLSTHQTVRHHKLSAQTRKVPSVGDLVCRQDLSLWSSHLLDSELMAPPRALGDWNEIIPEVNRFP